MPAARGAVGGQQQVLVHALGFVNPCRHKGKAPIERTTAGVLLHFVFSMSVSLVVERYQASSRQNRDKIIEMAQQIGQSLEYLNEVPKKYFICIPQDETEDCHSIYVMEEYGAVDGLKHIVANTVLERLHDALLKSPEYIEGTPEHYSLSIFASFVRPDCPLDMDPYMVFATLTYDTVDSAKKALEGFSGVCAFSEREEPGTLCYNVLQDFQEPKLVRTLEMYINQEYLWEPHASSHVVQQNKKSQGTTRLRTDFAFLKFVDGYING